MRVAMAVALYKRPDLLILDEVFSKRKSINKIFSSWSYIFLSLQPTNHLDADTVRALCVALESYEVIRDTTPSCLILIFNLFVLKTVEENNIINSIFVAFDYCRAP